jgi:hypothetical protein
MSVWPSSLPSRTDAPRDAVLPFWHFIGVPGGVWTGIVGTGASQRFVVEWRNAQVYPETTTMSVEAIFAPDGDITFNYSGLSTDLSKGSDAAVGITSPGGNYGLQYVYDQASLVSNTAVTFAYPEDPWTIDYYSISGTAYQDGALAADASVLLDTRWIKTDSAGHYEFGDLEQGTYGVLGERGCDSDDEANVDVFADVTLDLQLTAPDPSTYHCALTSVDWVDADTEVEFTNSTDADVPLPFPVRLGNSTSTDAEVGNGQDVSFFDSDDNFLGQLSSQVAVSMEPDHQSRVLTRVTGTAPNRQFVIEWRDLVIDDQPDLRATYEAVLDESGAMSFAYKQIPLRSQVTQDTFVYYDDYDGINDNFVEYADSEGYGIRAGKSVTFYQPVTS